MNTRQFETDPSKENSPVPDQATRQTEGGSERTLAGRSDPQTVGQRLLQLQQAYGNRSVQNVVNQAPVIQTKLVVGAAHDSFEREADRVAAQIAGSLAGETQSVNQAPDSTSVLGAPAIQRMQSAEGGSGNVSGDVQQAIQQARGGGQPLPEGLRDSMERAFHTDFGDVRVHTDGAADQLNRALQARAFTTGQDIFFRRGEFLTHKPEGQELLAHELTHVVQQRNHESLIQRKLDVKWSKSADAYQMVGRPDFTTQLKRDVFTNADNDGEDYIVKFSQNDGLSFQFPSVHRRHKLAWSLWQAATNTILANGDEANMAGFQNSCFVSNKYKSWDDEEFEKARDKGSYLYDMAYDFFNNPSNVWLGPGDENMGKGGGLDKVIKEYMKNPTKTRRAKLREKAYDPRKRGEFEYRVPDSNAGEDGGWYSYDRPMSPASHQMGGATDNALDYLKKW